MACPHALEAAVQSTSGSARGPVGAAAAGVQDSSVTHRGVSHGARRRPQAHRIQRNTLFQFGAVHADLERPQAHGRLPGTPTDNSHT